jgi:hypothetical protein
MNQDSFDDAMRTHGIQEEVLHRISKVEAKNGVAIPDADWDDPEPQLFPVSCIYKALVREGSPEALPSTSVSSSLPTTPELPIRELSLEDSAAVASFLEQQLRAPPVPLVEMSAPVESPTAVVPHPTWYRVAFIGGISVREAPDVMAACTGLALPCNDVFGVSESVLGIDQRIYLRLADGRGWVFDDSLLVPSDPSVVKLIVAAPPGNFVQSPCGSGGSYASVDMNPVQVQGQVMSVAISTSLAPATPTSPQQINALSTAPTPAIPGFGDEYGNVIQPAFVSVPYLVELPGGIPVRVAPDLSAPLTGVMLLQGEVFHVSESMYGSDGQLYLCLADGRGWVMVDEASPAETLQNDDVAAGTATGEKPKDPKGHVPYWVRLRRAKLTGKPLPQRKKIVAAKPNSTR